MFRRILFLYSSHQREKGEWGGEKVGGEREGGGEEKEREEGEGGRKRETETERESETDKDKDRELESSTLVGARAAC